MTPTLCNTLKNTTIDVGIYTLLFQAVNGVYYVNGEERPELYLLANIEYTILNLSNSHPLGISETENGTDYSGYSNGMLNVTGSKTLYYFCRLHQNMGNVINVTD
jgi:hypothetical protein